MVIHGKCHCGNIAFDLAWNPDPAEIPARACTCSFCRKHGGLWTSNPAASLEVRIEDAAHASRYRFGTKTADFHLCARCGIVPVVTSDIDGRRYAVVSVNAFEGIDESRLRRAPASFDGEGSDTRLERRKRSWIGDVRFVQGAAQDDEAQIRAVVAKWMEASRAGDLDTVLDLMTDDVVFLLPGGTRMGKEEFARASRPGPGIAMPQVDGRSEIEELRVAGDWAFIRTRLAITMTPPMGLPVEREGHTLTVFRRSGGRWRLARDANLLGPPKAP
ncbi:MAG TPA: SgcJ/EcaC family oxidoreductase [Usitatibacter sp.]|nr:SgcJ/EcaC family oxidoreductase [Usitatibacter sp.]